MFLSNTWTADDSRLISHRGYAIRKDQLTPVQTRALRAALTMKPLVAPEFSAGIEPFPIYYESPSRWYVPRFWGIDNCGEPDGDARHDGLALRPELAFNKNLRPEQLPIVNAFRDGGYNGLICVPCGYGKTFMAIWLACQLKKRFLVVVHQEFLMEQWRKELEGSIPGIRIGTLQGSTVQTGFATPPVLTIPQIKERLRVHGLKVGGTRPELLARLREVEPEDAPALYDCCICMIQTVAGRDWPADTFSDFGFAIFDECHHLGAEYFSKALMAIQTKNMLGLSATPDRLDGLNNVFLWYLGPVRYQIKVREADDTVEVRVLRFTSADPEYAEAQTDFRGEISRPKLCNQLAGYNPRTKAICDDLEPCLREGRKLLVLSDRISHLAIFETMFKERGFDSIGYYVGGMKNEDRDLSATQQIILATFAMSSEGMNIRDLNTVILTTPKSRIEQAVGRIFRLKKEERTFHPIIFDVLDSHDILYSQYKKRVQFYEQCGYRILMKKPGEEYRPIKKKAVAREETALPMGIPMFRT
jgi:superfamily II DNA or RNA helicase